MSALRIIYLRTPTLAAAAIRAMPPWGPWSHCGLVFGGEVIEALALKGGVVSSRLEEARARASVWQLVELDVPNAAGAETWARGTIGCKYDWLGVLSIPARSRGMEDARRWYCSEHVARGVHAAGRAILTAGMHGVTPSQCAHLTFAAGHRVVEQGGGL